MNGTPPQDPVPPDLRIGAFSSHPPWLVDPDDLSWAVGIDALRAAERAEAPELTRRRRLPPGLRVVRVGTVLGTAVAGWALSERRGSREQSRAGLSRRLRRAFERLGPSYIKLGQILSSGEGLFPEELVERVPAAAGPGTGRVLRRGPRASWRRTWAGRSRPCSPRSIPSPWPPPPSPRSTRPGSTSGESVVVKVQRPTVAQVVRTDLAAMSWLAPLLVGRIPVAALANPPALVELFAETIVEELDFRLEAQNMLDVARVLADAGQRGPGRAAAAPPAGDAGGCSSWNASTASRGTTSTPCSAAGIDTEAVLRAALIAFLEGAML